MSKGFWKDSMCQRSFSGKDESEQFSEKRWPIVSSFFRIFGDTMLNEWDTD